MDATEKKRAAARAAMEFIEPGTILGVGTGSTVKCLIEMLPEVRDRIDRVVSSSKASTKLLEDRGFEVHTLNETGDIDLYIDGAWREGSEGERFDVIAWEDELCADGLATDSDDAEGAVTAESPERPEEAQIRAVLPDFTGRLSQARHENQYDRYCY